MFLQCPVYTLCLVLLLFLNSSFPEVPYTLRNNLLVYLSPYLAFREFYFALFSSIFLAEKLEHQFKPTNQPQSESQSVE